MKKKENDEIRITPDALISLVVTEAEERELASMPSLKEMNAQFHPSEQFQKKMDRLLKKAHRKEGWVQIWKPTKKVLIAFTSVMTALTYSYRNSSILDVASSTFSGQCVLSYAVV